MTNLVVDSSSIELPRRARPVKTDRVDGEKLLRLLLRHGGGERGMWHVVQVPSRAMEDARHASRARTMLQVERTRYRNRLHGLLMLHGVRLRLDAQFPARVARATDWAGVPLPPGVQARLLVVWRVLTTIDARAAPGPGGGGPAGAADGRGADRGAAPGPPAGGRRPQRDRCSPTNCGVATFAIGANWEA